MDDLKLRYTMHMKKLPALYISNTLSGAKEEFIPLSPGAVTMYHCGPTVYDTAHIGNFRTFILNDIIRRTFEFAGYSVDQVMNITDVDDKTIRRSQAEKVPLLELTRMYEKLFLDDLASLNILTPKRLLRATDHIEEMQNMIGNLIEHGKAYISNDGIYYSIGMDPHYGELAGIKMQQIAHTHNDDSAEHSRIAHDEYEKENPKDFALWKFATPDDGEAVWDAPFGKGRPGWHIECSAMATTALGPTIDIHTGGVDLVFPHHTNEIAQSEAATGKQFVRYWIHGGFMNVNDTKMSKSKGNFFKIKDLEEQAIAPLAFRYWLLGAHYKTQVNFTLEALQAAQTGYIRLVSTLAEWKDALAQNPQIKPLTSAEESIATEFIEKFTEHITNDFDTPRALALVWEFIKDKRLDPVYKLPLILKADAVFGLNLDNLSTLSEHAHTEIPAEITALAEAREIARANKDWAQADALRAEISARGFEVKDTPEGFKIVEL